MKFSIFNYDIHINKRGIKFLKDGQLLDFADWKAGYDFVAPSQTPILEQIYMTIANEFAKIDFRHVIDKEGDYRLITDSTDYTISKRPNQLQTKYDFFYVMMYQLFKYGNAIAYIERDKNGQVISLNPINVADYEMGNGYQIDDTTVMIKFKKKSEEIIELVDYKNVLHLRLNPNDVFLGDEYSGGNFTNVIVNLTDYSLNSMLAELKESGTVRGVIQIGNAGIGYSNGFANRTMVGQKEKISKQQEIIERIKATKGGVLVLDAGEEWHSLSSPFSTVASESIDKYIDMLMEFYGFNRKIINGEATYDIMEAFFSRIIVPRIEQITGEMNYKFFSKTATTQGHRIEYYRNPFEYVPLDKAIDSAYKAIQDTTTNERRRYIYHLPPVEGGDKVLINKNFEALGEKGEEDGNESN